METTYEKEGGNLKIIEPSVSLVSLEELLAQKEQVEREIVAAQATYTELQSIRNDRLAKINDLIDTARDLGVPEPANDTAETA